MNIFLYGIRSFGNLAMVLRSAEYFGLRHCYVHNEKGTLSHEEIKSELAAYSKGLRRRLIRVSAGAIHHMELEIVSDVGAFMEQWKGRLIAASLSAEAASLATFDFANQDCFFFGCEAFGLPQDIIEKTDMEVKISQMGITQSLNLAVAVSVFLYEFSKSKAVAPRE